MFKYAVSVFALCVSFSLSACGGQTAVGGKGAELVLKELPVAKKGCAIGGSIVRSSISNAQDFATTTARANLASTLKETIQQMVKKYVEEGQASGGEIAEELNTRVLRGLTEMDVIGGVVTRSYLLGNEVQMVVCIEPDTFVDAFDKMNQLSQQQRKALKRRAKVEFDEMDRQLEKLPGHRP